MVVGLLFILMVGCTVKVATTPLEDTGPTGKYSDLECQALDLQSRGNDDDGEDAWVQKEVHC